MRSGTPAWRLHQHTIGLELDGGIQDKISLGSGADLQAHLFSSSAPATQRSAACSFSASPLLCNRSRPGPRYFTGLWRARASPCECKLLHEPAGPLLRLSPALACLPVSLNAVKLIWGGASCRSELRMSQHRGCVPGSPAADSHAMFVTRNTTTWPPTILINQPSLFHLTEGSLPPILSSRGARPLNPHRL